LKIETNYAINNESAYSRRSQKKFNCSDANRHAQNSAKIRESNRQSKIKKNFGNTGISFMMLTTISSDL